MHVAGNVFDVWVFQRRPEGVAFLLLHTSAEKAARYFNGGRFWQIPSGSVNENETMTAALIRVLGLFGLRPTALWAAEHAYVIYNRRFDEVQIIGVFAAEVPESEVTLTPTEHSAYDWCTLDVCLERVHYRGLKEGLRSVHEYVTGVPSPARELCLYVAPPG
jgi:hypothetical protein